MSTKKLHSKAESIKTVNTNDLRQDKSMLWTLCSGVCGREE